MPEAYHGAGRRHRRVPHVRDPDSRSRAPRYVRAIEFHPGNARVVHHANLGVDRTRSSRQLDARDPEPGYAGSMERDARYPGRAAARVDARTGAASGAGGHAVAARAGQRSRRAAAPAADRESRARRRDRRLLLHRRAADADAGRPAAGQRDDRHPAGRARATSSPIAISCRWTSRCWPCSRTRTTSRGGWKRQAELPDGTTRWLIAIDDWDFRWQDVYRYAAPFALPKGTTISMRYTYDNSAANPRNPHRPPARVVWGQNTSDEMGDLWIQVIPRAARRRADPDRRLPPQGARRGSGGLHEAAAGAIRPTRCATTRSRACISMPGSSTRRSREFRAVAAAQPRVGADALQPRLRAVGARPARRGDRRVRGGAADRSRLRAGAQQSRRAAADRRSAGRGARALPPRRGAAARQRRVAHQPRAAAVDPRPRRGGGGAVRRGARAQATTTSRRWPASPGFARPPSDPSLRDAAEAVRLAERADEATRHQDVTAIDALAAAYAAAGRYEDAVRVARRQGSRSRRRPGR